MAVSISMMFGRLGSIVGSNLVGVLLENNCSATFLMYSGFILGEWNIIGSKAVTILLTVDMSLYCSLRTDFTYAAIQNTLMHTLRKYEINSNY